MKTALLVGLLLASVLIQPYITEAQSTTEPSVCEYKETRGDKTPINPKTNKPYTPDERNAEHFAGASISTDEIRQCLQAKTPIKNHHIVFEDYRDAWQELAKETEDYANPLLITGGVLHANAYEVEKNTGDIRLWEFRDPKVTKPSDLTDEQRKLFDIQMSKLDVVFIAAEIRWQNVFVDSPVEGGGSDFLHVIYHSKVSFNKIIFNQEAGFSTVSFKNEVSFAESVFNQLSDFNYSIFINKSDFFSVEFNKEVSFSGSVFKMPTEFSSSKFKGNSSFSSIEFENESSFRRAEFIDESSFLGVKFRNKTSFEDTKFQDESSFKRSIFKKESTFKNSAFLTLDFTNSVFDGSMDFRYMNVEGTLKLNHTKWESRVDLRYIHVHVLHWDSRDSLSTVKGALDSRDAQFGSATFREVRFYDLVDFSRTAFGQTKSKGKIETDSLSGVMFDSNTFEKESNFAHVTFNSPTMFINNRFHRSLDLTDAAFETQNARLCLSFNRINRLVFDPKHLGNPPGILPSQQFKSLKVNPLLTSRVRRIGSYECQSTV